MNTDSFDLIVVGAGVTGATVAYIAAHEYHQKVLVIEKKQHVGGMLYDEKDAETGLLVQRYGTHFLHTDDKNVYKFLTSIADWYPFRLRARAEVDGKMLITPFNFGAIDELYPPREAAALKRRLADEYAYEAFIPLLDMLKSDDKDISGLAKKLLHEHYIPLTAAERGVERDTLTGKVLIGQYFSLSYRDECYLDRYQMLPVGGFTALIKKMLSDERIELRLGADDRDYFRITKQNKIEFVEGKKAVPIVYTGSLDGLFGYRLGKLPYYLRSVEHHVEDARRGPAPCVVSHDDPYTSRTDFGMLSRRTDLEKTVVSYEYNGRNIKADDAFEFLPSEDPKARRRYQKYLRSAKKIEGLYLCGRLPNYQFQDISASIREAMEVISSIKLGEMDLVPDYVKYKRPPEELLVGQDNFKRDASVVSDLLIGDTSRDLPKVSVVIPTYKRLASLKRALESVWNQDLSKRDYDVVVVDNDPAQDNETQKYLETLQKENLYYYKNRVNLGAYGNMNRCVKLSRTKWMCMLHDDDVLFPNALRWAINSMRELNDTKLGAILPRQIQAFSNAEMCRRMRESGVKKRDSIKRRKRKVADPKRRWTFYKKVYEDTRRRFWRISKFDCYMVPFLYPAPSYGSLINRDAVLDIGGFNEGYPTDDNLTFVRMSEKYHCYLCGESWGVYSFFTADVTKPRSALQFVDAVVQYRNYMEKRSLRCKLVSPIIKKGAYTDAVLGDVDYGLYIRGYNVSPENYQYYTQYKTGYLRRFWARRLQKCWELWILLRTKLFGKRISFDLIKRCNGEHF